MQRAVRVAVVRSLENRRRRLLKQAWSQECNTQAERGRALANHAACAACGTPRHSRQILAMRAPSTCYACGYAQPMRFLQRGMQPCSSGASAGRVHGLVHGPAWVAEDQDQQTTTTAKQNPKGQSTQAGGSPTKGPVFTGRQADRQTEPEGQCSIPSLPAPCFLCVFRAAEEAEEPVGRPTRVRDRPAVAARAPTRAHHSFDGRSRARRARLAAMREGVTLRFRDHVARSRSLPFASLDSIAVISP